MLEERGEVGSVWEGKSIAQAQLDDIAREVRWHVLAHSLLYQFFSLADRVLLLALQVQLL